MDLSFPFIVYFVFSGDVRDALSRISLISLDMSWKGVVSMYDMYDMRVRALYCGHDIYRMCRWLNLGWAQAGGPLREGGPKGDGGGVMCA